MSMIPDPTAGVQIFSVDFGDEWLRVTFAEERDTTPNVQDTRSRAIRTKLFEEEIADVLDTLRDIVDRAYTEKRNPPERFQKP